MGVLSMAIGVERIGEMMLRKQAQEDMRRIVLLTIL